MEATIKILQSRHLRELNELITVFEKVFELPPYQRPGNDHLEQLLGESNFFAVVAEAENKVIAGLTVYILNQYHSEKPIAHIYDLAVLQEYQRKGIGKKLISFTREYCRQRDLDEMFVQAEMIDDYAIDFYRSTSPTSEEAAMHFSYRLQNSK